MRTKLAVVILAAISPCLLLLAFAAREHRRLALAGADAQLVQAARHVAARQDQLVGASERLLRALQAAPELAGDDRAACAARLAGVLAIDPLYNNLGLVDANGLNLCDALGNPPFQTSNGPHIRAGIRGEAAVGGRVVSPSTGRPVVPVVVPLAGRAGAPRRALWVGLRIDGLVDGVRRGELPAAARVTILDEVGRIVVSDLDEAARIAWAGLPASGGAVGTRGGLRVAVAPTEWGGFRVAVTLPEAVALADVNALATRDAALLAAAVAAALAAALLAAERLVLSPMRRLAAAVRRVEAGDLDAADGLARRGRGDDLGAVAATVARLARGLSRRVADLADREAGARIEASRDAATGLLNRRAFDRGVEEAVDEARLRPGGRAAVLLVDLDRFKAVNDEHGHAAGDRVLAVTAARLQAQVREGDRVARLGGDEFAVLLADVDADRGTAFAIAERVVRALECPIEHEGGASLRVGASVGVAFCPEDAASAPGLVRCADSALYAAKQGGRGRWLQLARATA